MDLDSFDVVGVDADDTLWPTNHLYQQLLDEIFPDADSKNIASSVNQERVSVYGYGALAFGFGLLDAVMQTSCSIEEKNALVLSVIAGTQRIHNDKVKVFEGVEEALRFLKNANKRLILLTKGSNTEQIQKTMKSGLISLFDSVQVLPYKGKAQYASIVSALVSDPQRFLMVGDSVSSDVTPVLELGGQAIWIHNKGSRSFEDVHELPDGVPTINTLGELPDLLLGKRPQSTPSPQIVDTPSPSEQKPSNTKILEEETIKHKNKLGESGKQTVPPRDDADAPNQHPALQPPQRNVTNINSANNPASSLSETLEGNLRGKWQKNEVGGGWEVLIELPENKPLVVGERYKVDVYRLTGEYSTRLVEIVDEQGVGWVVNKANKPTLLVAAKRKSK